MSDNESTSKSSRVSREDAEQRLITSFIDLLGRHPINEITVDLIASTAGLKSGHVLVHRYFESRVGLISATAHELSNSVVDAMNRGLDDLNGRESQNCLTLMEQSVEPLRRRAVLVGELMSANADPTIHAVDSRSITDVFARCFESAGLAPRIARAIALKVFVLMSLRSTHHDWMGASDADEADVTQLLMFEVDNAMNVAQQMGWI